MWFDIIKAPNPYGGKWKFLTREQYYEMDDNNKRRYHSGMQNVYQRMLDSLRARHQPLEAAPETLQNELIDLQKLRNFHSNQKNRSESVFSIEDDKNPPDYKLQTTPMGNIKYGESDLTEEEYNAATREEKLKYHNRKRFYGRKRMNHNYLLHEREGDRMRSNPNYTSPYNPQDSKSKEDFYFPTPSKEEYENMSNDDKIKFHGRMAKRYSESGEKDLMKFHRRMKSRLSKNSQLPAYHSIEEERNA
tara:strand:- start:1655 stop:2395 length:741 start_codon:yes stop_codon:yes gene_type:complete